MPNVIFVGALAMGLSLAGPARAETAKEFFAAKDRGYVHHLFATQAECDEARKKFPGINCDQWASFYRDGSATIVMTDIMNPATYVVEGDRLVMTVSPGELPRTLEFRVAPDFKALRLLENGTVWELQR